MHEVLVNRLGGLSLPRKSVVRLTDRPDMTLDVYRGRKTTMQQQQQQNDIIFPYDVRCTCAVLWKIEQFISQEYANKSLVLDTWKIVIRHCKKNP